MAPFVSIAALTFALAASPLYAQACSFNAGADNRKAVQGPSG